MSSLDRKININLSQKSTYAERITAFLDYKGLNKRDLEREADISNGLVGRSIKVNAILGGDTLRKLLTAFPDLNANWLITGIGEMLIDSSSNQLQEKSISNSLDSVGIPVIEIVDPAGNSQVAVLDVRAAAGYPSHYQDRTFWSQLPVLSLPFNELRGRTHIAIEIEGNSMEETIQHRDHVICYQISDWTDAASGYIYAVVTEDGIICKRLADSEGDSYTWRSDNPDYGDQVIHASRILQLWRVRYKISSNLRRIEPVTPIRDVIGRLDQLDSQIRYVNKFLDDFFTNRKQ